MYVDAAIENKGYFACDIGIVGDAILQGVRVHGMFKHEVGPAIEV